MANKPPLNLPTIARTLVQKIVGDFSSKEQQRALPSSKGGETPNQLETYRTQIYTHFTEPTEGSELLYAAENWVRIRLQLKTAGPVAVGNNASIAPVLSGKGQLLDDTPFECHLAKGSSIYITSQTRNRVNVTIEPIPWFEQLDHDLVATQALLQRTIDSIPERIAKLFAQMRDMVAPMATGPAPQQIAPTPGPIVPQRGPKPLAPATLPPLRALPKITAK